jgi:hypothetical protein
MQHIVSAAIQRQLIVVYILLNLDFFSILKNFPYLLFVVKALP